MEFNGTEYLCVERKKVQCLYASTQKIVDPTSESFIEGKLQAYYDLFGDKCLPDKPSNGAMGATPPAFKLDVKQHPTSKEVADLIGVEYDGSLVPKFRKGDKVLDLILADIVTIEDYNAKTERYQLRTDAGSMLFRDERDLEPYTEENKESIVSNDDTMDDTKEPMEEKELNRKALYNALCELESASVKIRKALISM